MILHTDLGENGYDIHIERGALGHAGEYFELDRRVLVVTDDGVPAEYAAKVANACREPHIVTMPHGEHSKSEKMLSELLSRAVEAELTRSDCIVAVGGGVVGDLAGFAAAIYMRGIDFYNIPTTLLSQVDSSIGGKTAIDFCGYKNIVGAFKQPRAVIIDPELLSTLPKRQLSNGLAEAIKMALTSDAELFSTIEHGDAFADIDTVIERSLKIKKYVVEHDEKEAGLRRVLNFGHTLAHAIESADGMSELLHGECVGMGMLPMCSEELRPRVRAVLEKYGLPTTFDADIDVLISAARHDKKAEEKGINAVCVNEPGSFEFCKMSFDDFEKRIREAI